MVSIKRKKKTEEGKQDSVILSHFISSHCISQLQLISFLKEANPRSLNPFEFSVTQLILLNCYGLKIACRELKELKQCISSRDPDKVEV